MKKSAVLFVYFLYKKSAFCLKITANNFGFLDQKTKNKNWNEPNNRAYKVQVLWKGHKSLKKTSTYFDATDLLQQW